MNFKKMVGNQVRVRALAEITAKSYFFADKNKLSSPSLKWMRMDKKELVPYTEPHFLNFHNFKAVGFTS